MEAQNSRIRIVLEREAFLEIHRAWKRLGFPFASLTPSFAAALGSSGDNPAALAELAGIILNDGVRYPSVRIRELHFAAGSPLDTILEPRGFFPPLWPPYSGGSCFKRWRAGQRYGLAGPSS